MPNNDDLWGFEELELLRRSNPDAVPLGSVNRLTSASPDPATPTCDFCGARVHAPCSNGPTTADSLESAAVCQLPPDTVYVDDRRANMIGGPGVAIAEDDARHPDQSYARFEATVQTAINCCSMEGASNTPDFILSEFLASCLRAYDVALQRRNKWTGHRIIQMEHQIAALCTQVDASNKRGAELAAQLEAEGEHTAAANANIDRLNTEIERITRRQQGILAGKGFAG